ncbi:MAG: ABC transporter substrate-binding protein [Bacteroidales bacterium]|nr:ABC transporter substrate-binding protein [Bacteroidales bacterium]
MKTKTLFFILITFLFIHCKNEKTQKNADIEIINQNKYAQGFVIEKNENITKISVVNPWQNAENEVFNYYLIPKENTVPDSLKNEKIIFTPISKVVCLSTTHLGFLEVLDERNSIYGLSGTYYVYDSIIQQKIDANEIAEVGFEQNLDIEKIISIKPDVVFAYDITGTLNPKYEQLNKLGITVVLVGEYLENNPLGKAEWLNFFAAFYQKDSIAKEHFDFVEKEYNKNTQLAVEASSFPGVLINTPFQGIWYLPGGESYMSKIIADAGGNYLWNNKKQVESFPVSLEEIFSKNEKINILINPGVQNTKKEILATENRLSELNCIKNNNIFNNNNRIGKNGGNDIWESGTVNPHLILNDLIQIFHPELFPNTKLYYYKKIE